MVVWRAAVSIVAAALVAVGLAACDPLPPPVVVEVTSAADSPDADPSDGVCETTTGGCTLRAALQQPDVDRIDVPAGMTIQLTSSLGVDVEGGLHIGGVGDGRWRLDGSALTDPVVDVHLGAIVLSDLEIVGGAGVGLRAESPATVVVLARSLISGSGGAGVLALGDVVLVDSEVRGGDQHGIWALAWVTLTRSTVAGNAWSGLYADSCNDQDRPVVQLTDSTIEGNESGVVSCGSPITVTGSTISGNRASGIDGRTLLGSDPSNVRVTGSVIEGNAVSGISYDGGHGDEVELSVVGTSVSGNGIGLDLDAPFRATITRSVVSRNDTTGIRVVAGDLAVSDSTIADNGTGIREETSTVTLRRSTVAADDVAVSTATSGRLVLAGSVLAVATGSVCGAGITTSSLGWNLVGDTSCGIGWFGDVQGVDPLLGPLGDGGGPTETMRPGPGSPAIDAIPPGIADLCVGALIDQRGVARPQGPRCDRGAVEAEVGA